MSTTKPESLTIKTATVTIKTLQVNNHKMTKATFNQIPMQRLPAKYKEETALGWANGTEGAYLLWVSDGELIRSPIFHTGIYKQKYRDPLDDKGNYADDHWCNIRKNYDQLYIAT